jgi:hypothetical protein
MVHFNELTTCEGWAKTEVAAKWSKFYPDEPLAIFEATTPGDTQTQAEADKSQPAANEPPPESKTELPADPEAQERDAIWDMIVDRYAVEDWEAALLTLNMAKTKPPTIDGCLALLDHLKDNFERLA